MTTVDDLVDPWTERHLLGALTYRPQGIEAVVESGLEPGHFTQPAHARAYFNLFRAWCDDVDPDPGLQHDGVDGPAYGTPQVSDPEAYAHRILNLAERRNLYHVALEEHVPFYGWQDYWEASW